MVFNRVNCCALFAERDCPHQKEMERVYLIPQLLEPEEMVEYQNICMSCPYCEAFTQHDTADAVHG